MKRRLRNRDVRVGLVILVCTGVYFFQTFNIRIVPLFPVSGAFLPRICAVFMFGLGLALVWQGIRKERVSPTADPSPEQRETNRRQTRAVAAALAILFASILLLQPLGFIISMTLYLMASFLSLSPREKRNIPFFTGVAVVFVVGTYLIFVKGFSLLLPAGILG